MFNVLIHKPLAIMLAVFAASCLLSGCAATEADSVTENVETTVVRVIDGDTLAVKPVDGQLDPTNNKKDEHSLRLLGIDAPEMNFGKEAGPECGAQEATDHLEQLLPAGTQITISYDSRSDHTDRFGRSLSYVSTDSVSDVAGDLATGGYVEGWYPRSEPKPEHYDDYQQAAEQARDAGRGTWQACGGLGRN
jgi:micrococcal nuclease